MSVFALIVFAVVLYRVWTRMDQLAAAVELLTLRVSALETRHAPRETVPSSAHPPALTPAVATPSAQTPAVVLPPLPKPTVRTPEPAPALDRDTGALSWEVAIGSRWLLVVGVAAIVIAGAYFQRLALDRGWINETVRVLQGAAAGALLIAAGLRFERNGYRLYGQLVTGGGIALLYVSAYSASAIYTVIAAESAFVLIALITLLAAWLADRHRSQHLAVMAVAGGFCTPVLLSTRWDPRAVLFPYDALLIAGTTYIAGRRIWPALNVASYTLTALTFGLWAARFYSPQLYLAAEIFITVCCAMFLVIYWRMRHDRSDAARIARGVLATAPWLYYVVSIAILSQHPRAMLVYVMMLAIAGAVAGARLGPIARLVAWAAATLPLVIWMATHAGNGALRVTALTAVALVYVVHLLSHFEASRSDARPLHPIDVALIHLNGLGSYAALYFLLRAQWPRSAAVVTALAAAWQLAIAAWRWPALRDHALQFGALGAGLLAVAIGLQFDGLAVTIGWAVEGAALIWLALRERRDWLRAGGALLFAIAALHLTGLQLAARAGGDVAVANRRGLCSLCLIGLSYLIAWLHARGGGPRTRWETVTALGVAQLLTIAFLTSEIRSGVADPLIRQMLISVAWAVQATALIVAGFRARIAAVRHMAIAIFALTIVKVLGFDVAGLNEVYRVASFLAVGLALLVTSFLYSRYRSLL